MPKLRAWLTRVVLHGRRPARRGTDSNRFRLTDGVLEERLPPGDVLFTGLFGLASAGGSADAGRPSDPFVGVAGRPARPGQIFDVVSLSAAPARSRLPLPDLIAPTSPRRPAAVDPADLSAVGRSGFAGSWGVRVGAAVQGGGVFTDGPSAPAGRTAAAAGASAADVAGAPRAATFGPARTGGGATKPVTVTGGSGTAVEPGTPVSPPAAEAVQKKTVERPFTRTEVLIGIRSADPIGVLEAAAQADPVLAGQIDPAGSRVILTGEDGVALTEVRLADGADPQAVVKSLGGRPWAAYAQPNYVFAGDPREFTPNDPLYTDPGSYLHTLAQTNLAWDTVTGDPSITLGVADDGVAINHSDLKANIWTNPGDSTFNGIDDDGNGFIDDVNGWNFNATPNNNNVLPSGDESHGTHVAGITAARTDNGVGVAGTAGGGNSKGDGARIVPIKWAGPGGWTSAMVASTYKYAGDNKLKMVNASYNFDFWVDGSGNPDPAVVAGFDYSYGKGVLHFNSAGNSGTLGAPRSVFTQPLFVASLNSKDIRSGFSNYGDFVDIAANGDGIMSTLTSGNGTGETYGLNSGTSMSTPHAMGVAALIWSKNPTWTREQVAAQLLGTADNVNAANPTIPDTLGAGRVNSFRAVTETIKAPVFVRESGLPAAGKSGEVTEFKFFVPRRLDPAGVVVANFELRGNGADDTFDTGDDVIVPLTINNGAVYRIGTDALAFAKVGGGGLDADVYRFTAFAGAAKLRDPFGTPLDGDGNGTGGDNFVRVFNTAPSIQGRVYEDFDGAGDRDANDPGVAGRTVYLDLNKNGVFEDGTPFTVAGAAPVAIADLKTVTADAVVSGKSGTIFDLDVNIDLVHTWDSDVDMFLIAPSGKRIELTTENGGDGDNYTNTTFDDEAATPITAGKAPFTGRFRPETPLSDIDGLSPNGIWTLEITDTVGGDVGTLNKWSLTFASAAAEPNRTTDAFGVFNFFGQAAGKYDVRTVTPGGFVSTGPAGGFYTVDLPTAESSVINRDFGTAKNDRYYGHVYDDKNANGALDPGEPPVVGRRVFEDLNANGVFDLGGQVSFTQTNATPLPIPDNNTKVFSSINVAGKSGAVVDLNVKMNITHTWDDDLDVFLIAPNGKRVELFTDACGSGDNFINTVLDDEAATSIAVAAAPATGSFRPEGKLSDIDGVAANGEWKLELLDDVSSDVGTLNNWSLEFTVQEAEPNVLTDALGNAAFDLAAGAHTMITEPAAGLTFTSPPDGKYVVTAAGAPLTGKYVGVSANVAPTVSTFEVLGGPQRSRVTTLVVTFSEKVQFAGGVAKDAFSIQRTPPGGGVPNSVTPIVATDDSTGKTVATLTFAAGSPDFGSLPDGKIDVTVVAAKVMDLSSTPMAADFKAAQFHRLFGDADGTGTVDVTDFAAFGSTFGVSLGDPAFLPYMDANNDKTIDVTDFAEFGARFGTSV